jgi:hypothetical protein
MSHPGPSAPLSAGEQRKRAAIDAGIGLVITMLLWPFPIARAMLAPPVNVALVLLTWGIVNIAYHAVCARVWRQTGAMYLLGFALGGTAVPGEPVDDAHAMRWGLFAGAFVVVNAIWPGVSTVVENAASVQLLA